MWRPIIAVVILFTLVFLGTRSNSIGSTNLPPVVNFFSPSSGFWNNGDNELDKELFFSELNQPAEVVIDNRLVPHIFANDHYDAFRIQGYMHASNRLFQMDVTSRFTAGRLAEFFGPAMIEIDKITRRRGLPFAAENAQKGWSRHEETMRIINAYVDGVNEYIKELKPKDYPLEYKLLNVQPEPWSVFKVACINKSMTFDLCFRNEDDIASQALTSLGKKMYEQLFPFRKKEDSPIIPPGTPWEENDNIKMPFEPRSIDENSLQKTQYNLPPEANGSNNWAVAGHKTANGNPILCNDPHLRLRLPSVWYECQLSTPEMNAYGVSLPGVPGIIIGFNSNLAWGVTNVGMDVLDWHKIKWTDESKTKYLIDEKEYPITWRVEKIKVKNGTEIIDSVAYTSWGPMTYDDDPDHILYEYSMRWAGHESAETDEFSTFIGLNKSNNLKEAFASISEFRNPAQNFCFATTNGDIALRIGGALPSRSIDNGEFLQNGDSKSRGWQGYLDQKHNPKVINPDRGYVSSANQITTDSTYPFLYYGYFADYRGRLLNKKLDNMSEITVDDMKNLQNNNESLLAQESIDMLLTILHDSVELSENAREAFVQLQQWDGKFDAHQIAPALFREWLRLFYNSCWSDFPENTRKPEFWRTIELAKEFHNHPEFDLDSTDKIETSVDLAIMALEKSQLFISNKLKEDSDYSWGEYNANRVDHLLGLLPFSSGINHADGFKYSLNAVSSTHGPSWKMVVELSTPVKAWGVYPGGQSGHPGHENYKDMLDEWTKGKYFKLNFYESLEQASTENVSLIKCMAQ